MPSMRLYIIATITAFFSWHLIAYQAAASSVSGKEQAGSQWEGVWFTCEFAQRQRAPDDGCALFDDEGFIYQDGVLSYLRMKGSQETACRGNKKGQCFKRNLPSIKASMKEIGDARIEGQRLIVRYLGCEQGYQFFEGQDFMTIKPENKACFWSRERHFYIAPFTGKLAIIK